MKMLKFLASGLMAATLALGAHAAGGAKHPHSPEGGWPQEGPFGKFDQASVQRGYQVYREVCASCHSMDLLHFRNLAEKGGPYYQPGVSPNDNPLIKEFASQYTYNEIDDAGDVVTRPGRPSDQFRNPYPNKQAARAGNGGALPPDLSVIVKARSGGADYIYSLISGYPEVTSEDRSIEFHDDYHGVLTQNAGLYYNPYFPGDTVPNWDGDPRHAPSGGFLAMPPQLIEPVRLPEPEDMPESERDPRTCDQIFDDTIEELIEARTVELREETGDTDAEAHLADVDAMKRQTALDEKFYTKCTTKVAYRDGTYPSIDQMAKDVTAFLAWASEPKQTVRKSMGLGVMIFLFLLAVLLWFSYRRIWRNVEH